jgi:hypothetical protein
MKLSRLFGLLCAALLLSVMWTAPASAQATRTWVSGVGDDANPCSRTAPCKTFAGAISKTAAGGEIDALDPGGFGALTITKSITIDGGGGQVASVLVAGTNGIVVAAGATDVVILRNLRFDGLLGNGGNSGNAGINGIRWISGLQLRLEHDVVFGFNTACIDDESNTPTNQMAVVDTQVMNCTNAGVLVAPAGGVVGRATLDRVTTDQNGIGLLAQDGARVFAHYSEISMNNGDGVKVNSAGTRNSFVFLDHSTVSGNGTNGLETSGAAAQETIVISDTDLQGNAGASLTGSQIQSFGNNHINNNSTNNAPTGTPISPQ